MARVFIELAVKGGGRALVEPGMVAALITRGDLSETSSAESPLAVILRGYGDTLELIGISAHMLLAKMDRVSVNNKQGLYDTVTVDGETFGRDTVVIYMDGTDGA